jgi:hypothetical protein
MPWRANGVCRSEPARKLNWHPEPNDTKMRARCKAVCFSCSVRTECLAYAISNYEFGVWGGTSERERKRLRKQIGSHPTTEIVITRIEPGSLPDNVVPLRLSRREAAG